MSMASEKQKLIQEQRVGSLTSALFDAAAVQINGEDQTGTLQQVYDQQFKNVLSNGGEIFLRYSDESTLILMSDGSNLWLTAGTRDEIVKKIEAIYEAMNQACADSKAEEAAFALVQLTAHMRAIGMREFTVVHSIKGSCVITASGEIRELKIPEVAN